MDATLATRTTTLYTVGDLETFNYDQARQHQMENPHLAISLSIAEATEYRVGDRRTFDYEEFMAWTRDYEAAAAITVDGATSFCHGGSVTLNSNCVSSTSTWPSTSISRLGAWLGFFASAAASDSLVFSSSLAAKACARP